MSRPLFLYENALEDVTSLAASTTAAGYDVDSVVTRIPSDRWTSSAGTSHTITAQLAADLLPTAFAITGHSGIIGTGDIPFVSDSFTRANETPLASPWTKRESRNLNLASNIATRAGEPSGGRAVYTHGTSALDANGYGWTEVDVRFSACAAAGTFTAAGVLLSWAAAPMYLYAVVRPYTGTVVLEKYGASIASVVYGALADNTWYTLRLEYDSDGARIYIDGTLALSVAAAAITGITASRVTGLVVESDDPALCVIDFNNFAAGPDLSDTSEHGLVILEGGDDGATWPYSATYTVTTNGTILIPFDDGVSHDYWRWTFPVNTSRAVTIGVLALGRRLNLTESMSQGFDPFAMKLVSHQARSNSGSYLGHVVRYPHQTVDLKFGSAGLSTTDFFNLTGTPSWRDFLRTTWARGRAFWFAWDFAQQPQDAWFAMVPANASTSAPFITAIRRGWKLTMDVLVESISPP